jgi:hypothetical protein
METKDMIINNGMFGAYNIVTHESYPILEIMEAMENLRERKKMGGDEGIHLEYKLKDKKILLWGKWTLKQSSTK